LPLEAVSPCHGARLRARLERQGTSIGDYDVLIVAQALAWDLVLVTNNVNEFERVPGLQIENWVA